jgi:hypothetical protein
MVFTPKCFVLMEVAFLKGRERIAKGVLVSLLVVYDEE